MAMTIAGIVLSQPEIPTKPSMRCPRTDRKSTRLNSSHSQISYAVFCLKKKRIVAAAATDKGTLYEGAFGKRELGKQAPMAPDTVVWIASMTKAITATAVMQLVEPGKLGLERPASEVVPDLARAKVLEGFDPAGKPRLRAPKRPITLRHLLTHTAGFGY